MANRAERRRRMKTSELRELAVEAMNQTPYIDVETDNGEEFRIWHPLLVDDEAQKRIELVQTGRDLDRDENDVVVYPPKINGKLAEPDVIRLAKAVMGDVEHKRFIKAGGTSQLINLAWYEMQREYEELKEGEDDPK